MRSAELVLVIEKVDRRHSLACGKVQAIKVAASVAEEGRSLDVEEVGKLRLASPPSHMIIPGRHHGREFTDRPDIRTVEILQVGRQGGKKRSR